jgi:hypothetical protein
MASVRRTALGTVALTLSLLLTGCASEGAGPAARPSTSPAPTSPSSSPAGQTTGKADPTLRAISRLLRPDGTLSPKSALAVFAALRGGLPGVEPAPLGNEPPGELIRPALSVLVDELPRLPPRQAAAVRRAVEELTGPDEPTTGDAVEVDIQLEPSGSGAAAPVVPRDAPSAAELRAELERIRDDLAERTGHRPRLPIRARVVPDHVTRGAAVTVGAPLTDAPNRCVVTMPLGMFDDDTASLTSTLAHEVWHCFQYDFSWRDTDAAPLWQVEGQAEWAGEEYVGGSASSAARWDTWLLRPADALFRRSYDALGLYAVAAQGGADPWRTMLPSLRQRGQRAVATVFGTPAQQALGAVAEALVREPALGGNWESTGPGITGADGSPTLRVSAGGDDGVDLRAGRFGTLGADLQVGPGEVLVVEARGGEVGALELNGLDRQPLAPAGETRFCLDPGGCECPDGSHPGGGDPLPRAQPGKGAAALGTTSGGQLRLAARFTSLEDECSQDFTGRWHIPVRTVLTKLLTAYGGASSPFACDGPMYLSFLEDGTTTLQYRARCQVGDSVGHGRVQMAGRYRQPGPGQLEIIGMRGGGTMTVRGVAIPLPGLDNFGRIATGRATYRLAGNQLTITFTAPDGKQFTFTYNRA